MLMLMKVMMLNFEKYHEKVVDLTLRFEPTAEDCVEIALPGKSDELSHLRECICRLNISIRTSKNRLMIGQHN